MTELIHWAYLRGYGSGGTTYSKRTAWCYHRHTDPGMLTDDVFKVTCGKCQRGRAFKEAAAKAF